jgi:hypothetical protein
MIGDLSADDVAYFLQARAKLGDVRPELGAQFRLFADDANGRATWRRWPVLPTP